MTTSKPPPTGRIEADNAGALSKGKNDSIFSSPPLASSGHMSCSVDDVTEFPRWGLIIYDDSEQKRVAAPRIIARRRGLEKRFDILRLCLGRPAPADFPQFEFWEAAPSGAKPRPDSPGFQCARRRVRFRRLPLRNEFPPFIGRVRRILPRIGALADVNRAR